MESTATDRTESRSLKTQPRDNPEAIATRAINFRTAIFAKKKHYSAQYCRTDPRNQRGKYALAVTASLYFE